MPRLPIQERGMQPVESAVPTPGALGAGTARSMSTLGNALLELGATMKDSWDESRSSREVAGATKSLQDFTLQLQYGGVDPETGQEVPPPPPDQHQELYQKEVERIRSQAESTLGPGRALRMFESEFTTMSNRQDFAIKKNALEQYSNEIKTNMKVSLQQKANNFVEAGPLQKPAIQRDAFKSVDDMVVKGIMTPAEGQAMKANFISEASAGSIMKLIRTDPEAAILSLESGEFKDLPADEQQKWLTSANSAYDRKLDREIRLNEKRERDIEKAHKKVEEQTAKDLWQASAKGTLTIDQVERNEMNLSKDDYKLLLNRATGRDGTSTNMQVYTDLRFRVGRGEDVTSEIKQQAISGNLTESSFNTLMAEVEANSPASDYQNWYKTNKKAIGDELLGSNPDLAQPDAKAAFNRAIDAWNDWARENPKASPEQARRERQAIIKENRLVDLSGTVAGMIVPRYLKGGVTATSDLDAIEQAKRDTKAAYEAGEISRSAYGQNADALNKLSDRLKKQQQEDAAAKETR